MIDLSWHAPAAAFDAAAAGDEAPLRASLDDHGVSEEAIEAVLATVRSPAVLLEVLRANADGLFRQRAHLGARLSILHADGDDRDERRSVMVAPSPVELVHTLLAGFELGPRDPHDAAALEAEPGSVRLDHPEQGVEAVLGQAQLPAGVGSVGDPSQRQWWGLRWYAPDEPEQVTRLQVLDVGRLWVQEDLTLLPADAVGVLGLLASLLGELSRITATASTHGDEP